MKTFFENANVLVFEPDAKIIKANVLVENNHITKIGKFQTPNCCKVINCENKILMPGLINAHMHPSMSLLRGVKDDAILQEWLFENIFPLENQLEKEDIFWGTKLTALESIRAGITTVQSMYFNAKEIAQAIKEAGLRANIGVFLEKTTAETTQLLEEVEKINPLGTLSITVHSIYTTNENQIEQAVDFARKFNMPINIHLSETLKEVGDCSVQNGCSPVEFLEKFGFFDGECSLFHCVHLDKADMQILADNGVSVVSCPTSNLKLGSGIAPLFSMKNMGINIALGTDGEASNNSQDIFREMLFAAMLQKGILHDASVISASDVLKFATKNAAKAVAIENIGEIKEGFLADIILINTTLPHWQPKNNLVSHLVYSAKSSDVCFSMINGEIVFENGIVQTMKNENEIFEKAEEIVARLKKNANVSTEN